MISDKLYELAFEFKKTKLWDVLWKNLFFAVKLPDNKVGYVRMTRGNGEIYALELYIGENGLESLRNVLKADKYQLEPFEYQEVPFQQSCLQCALVGKAALSEEEREEVKVFARSHGIKIGGKNAYPRFMKFQPYYCPWHLQTEEEQENLCEALAAAIAMSKLLEGKMPQELGLMEVHSETKEIILLERREGVYVLGKTELLPEKEKKWPMPEVCNDISIAKLKKIKRSGIWECGFIRISEPVKDEEEEIPLFPILLIVINSATGYILPVPLVVHYEDNPEELMNFFMEALLDENICPGEIKVEDSRAYAFFKPFCEKLKIAITEVKFLPSLKEAEAAFYSDFGMDRGTEFVEDSDMGNRMDTHRTSGLSKSEVVQSLEELLDIFSEVKQGQQNQLPESILNQFELLLENGNLPQRIEDKISRLLGTDRPESGSTKSRAADRPRLESVNFKLAKEAEGKSYVISVSLGAGCYRHIQISCNALLLELHSAIIAAFGFDDDHAHAFFLDNKLWSDQNSYFMEEAAEDFKTTRRYRLSQIGLYPGMKFKYLFDFGDEWRFQCKVLKELETVTKNPKVIKVKGEAPEQYPDWDDDWYDE